MKTPKTLLPFFAFAFLHLLAKLMDFPTMADFTKPLLMVGLMIYFNNEVPKTILSKFVNAALFLSLLGDVFLIFSDAQPIFFLLGLASFLFAHLVYIFLNLNLVDTEDRKLKFRWHDLLFGIYGLVIFQQIKPGLGDMMIPALLYTIVICIMGITASKRWGKTDKASFWWIMIGAFFFIISDSILAINQFGTPFPQAGFLIMFTYIIAQFMIVRGIVEFIKGLKASE
ncbi:lysoplasmalogenase [Roseivirga seohaensis]|uniref:lysoplasmalogenase n=1 Tax=Roseivirga seohaensis TaxID=1914963 RepID=UPI003BAA2C91